MPAAVAIPSLIGAGTSLVGGLLGSNAASNAANLQYKASQDAMAQIKAALAGVTPGIQTAADQSKADALAAALTSGANLTGAAGTAGTNLVGAAGSANALLNPYIQGGTSAFQNLASLMQPGGQLTQQFGLQQMQQNDPGYQFRIDQANKALQASAAARGGALGGGALRSLQNQSQNLASSEMQNAYGRWQDQQTQLFNRLNTLGGAGLTAGNQAGANLMNAYGQAGNWNVNAAGTAGNWLNQGTQYGGTAEQNAASNIANTTMNAYRSIADLMTGGAAAQAGGVVGSANAMTGALGGVGNAANQAYNAYQQQNLLDWLKNNSYITYTGTGSPP